MDGAPAAVSAPGAVEDRGVDPRIDADRVPAGRNGPTGKTAGAAGGRRWVRSTAQPSAVNAKAEAVLDHAAWNIGDQSAVTVSAAGPRGLHRLPLPAVACWSRPGNRREVNDGPRQPTGSPGFIYSALARWPSRSWRLRVHGREKLDGWPRRKRP